MLCGRDSLIEEHQIIRFQTLVQARGKTFDRKLRVYSNNGLYRISVRINLVKHLKWYLAYSRNYRSNCYFIYYSAELIRHGCVGVHC